MNNEINELSKDILRQELYNLLKSEVLEVNFIKTDGTKRRLICTLLPGYLPAQQDIEEQIKRKNENIVCAWDIENQGWRSFRIDSIIEYSKYENTVAGW